MGSRGRSIRLRIYFLVTIPLITMLGLFGYVAYTSVSNWLNLDRAPSLIQATSEPLTNFVYVLQAERRAAVVYLSQPNAASLATFQAAVTTTKQDAQKLKATLRAPATTDNSTPAETAAIGKMTAQIDNLNPLRTQVTSKKLAPLDALAAYTEVIAGQGTVLQAEVSSIKDGAPELQGLGLISAVNTQEDVAEQDAVLAGALAGGSLTAADRVAFSNAVGRQQGDTLTYQQLLTPAELTTYTTTLNKLMPQSVQDNLAAIQQAVPAGTPLSGLQQQGLTPVTWQTLTSTWLKARSVAGTASASAVLEANRQPAIDAKHRVWITAAVGVAGLILTLIVTILLARSINRRLAALRKSALTLAQEQLPAVVARLRRGEPVDVAAEAPPLRAGNDEIGQLGEAIDAVRQTAIRSAVEEANVRQGVNDMFRNLARRNQSLLQRQLSVLDDMERRATDPDVLEDLFKMDHLTTRMRRHAEGLIILSGAPPGRSWSAPVKLIDVMRGAVAEVEDYARVTVTAQSRAALSGSAVTDVIHLLAELIENATSLSPPFTQVRVSGDTVANGFAIEIEDRGLGMVPERLQELNERLANPPGLNPANTEQLGLFVVGQLARRHGIRVVLRQSPYGGTTAVALIPLALIVAEGPPAITVGGPAAAGAGGNGFRSRGPVDTASPSNGAYGNGYPGNGQPGNGYPGNGFSGVSDGAASLGGPAGAGLNGWPAGTGANGWPANAGLNGQPASSSGREAPAGAPFDLHSTGGQQDPGGPTIRISGALRHRSANGDFSHAPGGTGPAGGPAGNGNGNRQVRRGTEEIPVVTGIAFGRPVTPPEPGLPPGPARPPRPTGPTRPPQPGQAPPFDVFTPMRRPDADYPYERSHQDSGAPARPGGAPYQDQGNPPYPGGTPYQGGSPYPDRARDQNGPPNPGGQSYGGDGYGIDGLSGNGFSGNGMPETAPGATGTGDPAAGGAGDFDGLPRRVRQASLAPQLRTPAAAAGPQGPAAVPPVTAASLADMRSTLSAMQRGWQQGRSQPPGETEGNVDGD